MTIKFEPKLGSDIKDAIREAIRLAKLHKDGCEFEFNGVTVCVKADSAEELIHRDWVRGIKGYIGEKPVVGPYPQQTLSKEELDSDAAIQLAKDIERAARRAEQDSQAKRDKAKFNDLLATAGAIELKDVERWEEIKRANTDPYGARILSYAEDWARLMQVELANGKALKDCANDLSHLADYDGITGFMYGSAVLILSECWQHGEELRRWHNIATQLGNEGEKANESGGVLNPAILNITN